MTIPLSPIRRILVHVDDTAKSRDRLALGQREAADALSGWVPSDFVEYVIAAGGKPALVVPHSMAVPAAFGTVLIAWKETREAARAGAAAMPLLQRARRVVAVAWGDDEAATADGLERLAQHLRTHGVDEVRVERQGVETPATGELLLSRAADHGAELLVMGCY